MTDEKISKQYFRRIFEEFNELHDELTHAETDSERTLCKKVSDAIGDYVNEN